MQVEVGHAPATASYDGRTYYFCSDHCSHRFSSDPERFTTSTGVEQTAEQHAHQ
jgi:YHS domain-containing protein